MVSSNPELHASPLLHGQLLGRVNSYGLVPRPQYWVGQGATLETIDRINVNISQPIDEACIESFLEGACLRGWDIAKATRSDLTLEHHDHVARNGVSVLVTLRNTTHEDAYPTELSPQQRKEGYGILVEAEDPTAYVIVEADAPAGFFYAAQTLVMLLVNGELTARTSIWDWPRFEHRGFMLDVARSYQPVSVLRDVISAAAALKLNVVHLHLVDDQGWRVEITNEGREPGDNLDYTRLHCRSGLTAVNGGDNPGFDAVDDTTGTNSVHDDVNRGYETVPPGQPGWYTQDELRELVAFAASMNIRVVPELEFPGHNHSVLYALPELATGGAWTQATPAAGGQLLVEPWTRWQVGYSYLDFNNPATWRFVAHIMRQFAQIFGTHTLHVGADECYNMVKAVGDENYDQIVGRIVGLAHELGFQQVTLWQEGVRAFSQVKTSSGHSNAVQLWNYTDPAEVDELLTHAANNGAGIINSDGRHFYLDQKIDLADSRGLTWAVADGLPTRATYDWDPLQHIPSELHASVRGIEACLWAETVRNVDDIAYLGLPRLGAIAEVGWTSQERRSWQDVALRLREHQ